MKSDDKLEILKQQFTEEFSANKKLQAYLSKYEPKSTESFMTSYIRKKAMWYHYSDFNIRKNEEEDMQWVEDGIAHLARIQQKKLFNIQCEWRAEKYTLPSVEICEDFRVWQNKIFECPFIEPITEQEVELYIEFLKKVNLEDDAAVEFWNDWQYYEDLKAAADPDSQSNFSNYPEWYEFYDMRFGTGALLSLSDIRGQKENRYIIESNKQFHKKLAEKKAEEKPTPQKPRFNKIPQDEDYLYWFFENFDSSQTKKFYEADKRYSRVYDEAEEIMKDIKLLLKSGESLPIEANTNWIEAIKQTVNRYRTCKIIEFLPHTYEQYKLKNEMNIFPNNDSDLSIRELYLNKILDGRELLGEPRDLDF